jgi:GNAT superfamily N-acetyltransferase
MQKVREFTPEDAASLAQCMNESEGGWPGGITGGVQHTAEHVMEDYNKQVKIAWLIAVSDGKVVGISTLHPHYEDPEAAYLGFLNVSDAYRKKGFGKALLLESVRRVTEEGYRRLFLHTWAGNLNAVPVYKKTGFFWRPETQVLMENYVPSVLKLPIAKPFFEKHADWNEYFQRKIAIEPDEMEHRGLHVYELLWRADNDMLRVVFDRESRGATLIETENLKVECWVANPEPPLGIPLPVEWTIHNKQENKPLRCELTFSLPRGFRLLKSPQKSITVTPGKTCILESSILGSVSVIPKPKDKAAYALKSHLKINGTPLELETGLQVKHPVEFKTVPKTLWCRPGAKITLPIRLKSNIKTPTKGIVTLKPPRGVHLAQNQFNLDFEPEGFAGAEIEVTVDPSTGSQAFPIIAQAELHVNGQALTTRKETIYLNCLTSGGVLITPFEEGRRLQVHTEKLQFEINLFKGAHIDRLYSKDTGRMHFRAYLRNGIGPPFWPSEQMRTQFQYRIVQPGDGTTQIIMWMNCQKQPGLRFTKTLILTGSSSIIRVDYSFENSNPATPYKIQLSLGGFIGSGNHLQVLPLADGILREEAIEEEFFASSREVPKHKEDWAETWYCAEFPDTGEITAILFDPSIFHETSGVTFLNFTFQVPPVKPNSNVKLPPVYMITGNGTWHQVQNLWRQLFLGKFSAAKPTQLPHNVLEVTSQPFPLLIKAEKQFTVPIILRHHVYRPLEGKLSLTAPKGWQITPKSVAFKEVQRKKPFKLPVTFTASNATSPEPQILPLQIHAKTTAHSYTFDLPIILSSKTGKVQVNKRREEDNDIFVLDNGSYQMKVAPAFSGTVYSLTDKSSGINYLKSLFPKAGPMVWINPWFGGVCCNPFPIDHDSWLPTRLHHEVWTGKPVELKNWKGVALKMKPGKEERRFKGFRFEFLILTQPHSNIMKLISRYVNLSSAPREINHRLEVSVLPGGTMTGLETVVPRSTRLWHRRRATNHAYAQATAPYIGIEHPKRGESLIFISPHGPEGAIEVWDMPPDIVELKCFDHISMPSKVTKERVGYVVIAKTPWEKAKQYAILAD